MFFAADPIISLVLFAVLGLALGSFGNVLVFRLPHGNSVSGRSHCPHCKKVLVPLELIPIVSFLLQWGKCRGCGQRISLQYPIVELFSSLLFMAALFIAGFFWIPALCLSIALWALLLIVATDIRTQLIPDLLTGIAALFGLLFHLTHGQFPIFAPIAGLAFFGIQWILSRGRWVGSGDVFLAGAIGFILGYLSEMIWCILFAYMLGALWGVFLLVSKKETMGARIAFGPFLIISAVLVMFFAPELPLIVNM